MFGELRAFFEVSRCGSIRKASDKLDLAPSSVSRRVATLERRIGTQLLERGAVGVGLTHAGRLVADFAGPVISEYDALCTDLNELRGSRRQLIRVCATASVPYMRPGSTIARFRERYDSVTYRFDSAGSDEAIQLIKAGSYDIGIVLRSAPDPEIEVVARVTEPIVLVVHRDHPLAGRTSVAFEELGHLPLALLTDRYAIRQDFDGECRRNRISPMIVLESSSLPMLVDFVKSGLGGTLMPRRTVDDPDTVPVLIDATIFSENTLDLLVLRHRRLPRLVRLFVQALAQDMAGEQASAPVLWRA